MRTLTISLVSLRRWLGRGALVATALCCHAGCTGQVLQAKCGDYTKGEVTAEYPEDGSVVLHLPTAGQIEALGEPWKLLILRMRLVGVHRETRYWFWRYPTVVEVADSRIGAVGGDEWLMMETVPGAPYEAELQLAWFDSNHSAECTLGQGRFVEPD